MRDDMMLDVLGHDRAEARSAIPDALSLRVRELVLETQGSRLIDGISLDLAARGCTVIMGPNGAGKSLFVKLLHGLMKPSSGEVSWGGRPAQEMTTRQALVFQKPVLLRRSVAANIDFVLKARGRPRALRDGLLAQVGLSHKAAQPARLLSGGEAQRLALARALASAPDILFLDEPTANLDPASVRAIEEVVQAACAHGLRVIWVTHDTGQARRLADDVLFMHRGRLLEHGSGARFFSDPRTRAARDFLGGRILA